MMSDIEERHAELLAIDDSPAVRRVITMLDELYSPRTPPCAHELDHTVFQLIHERWVIPTVSVRRHAPRLAVGAGIRLLSAVVAVVIALGGLIVHLNQTTLTPVSAQTVLNRAAQAGLVPGHATHFVYDVTTSDGYVGAESVWIVANGQRRPTRLALAIRMLKDGTPAPTLDGQLVATSQTMHAYDPTTNTVTISPVQGSGVGWLTIVEGTSITRKLQIRASSPSREAKGLLQKVHRLPERSLQGFRVYVLRINGNQTFYFDTRTYVLRGADWSQNGRSWQVRLVQYHVMSPGGVPRGTFNLRVPPSARVVKITL